MKKKKDQRRPTEIDGSPRKLSEMIWEFAGGFIRLGNTLEEKQNLLNAACTAWNMACTPSEVRNRSLDQYVKGYKSYNPDVSDEEMSAICSDVEKLMRNKLRLFPAVHKQIVGAQITQVAGKDNIEVVSTRLE